MKKQFIPAGLCATLLCAAGANAQAAPKDRPDRLNILWLTFEDTSAYMFSCYGNAQAYTPNLNALAAKGVRFTNASSVSPYCSPARSGLISGCYATTWGHDQHRGRRAAGVDRYLFPMWLKKAGYFCTNNRKTDWNNDNKLLAPWIPLAFDMNATKEASYNSPARKPGQPFFAIFNNFWTHMNCVATIGMDFREKPQLSPEAVILPPHVPDLPAMREDYAEQLQQVEKTDAWFGTMLDDLKARGLDEDTIIFIFSDNGGTLPRGNGFPYQSGFRVPLVVYIPPRWQQLCTLPPGTVTDRLVDFTDFGPTVLSLAGVTPPEHMQGKAFMGGSEKPPRKYQFCNRCNSGEYFNPVRTVYDGRFKYIRNFTPYKPYAVWQDYQWQMPAQRAWDKLYLSGKCPPEYRPYYESNPAEMLFDLKNDPGELQNLAGGSQYQPKLEELRGALSGWLRETRDKGLVPLQMRDREKSRSMYDRMEAPDFPLEELYRAAETASRARTADMEALKKWTYSETPELRYWGAVGCAVLAQQGLLPSCDRLDALLRDPYKDVSFAAAEALWYSGGGEKAYRFLKANFLENNEPAARSIEMFTLAGSKYISDSLRQLMISDMRQINEAAGSSEMEKQSARALLNRLGVLDIESVYSADKLIEAKKRYLQNEAYKVGP